ncbi:MAG: VOC family protein [Oscillospiraceae bacterium]
MIKKIDHIVITTTNFEECVKFYEKIGFKTKDTAGRYELYAGDFKINVHLKDYELFPHARNVQSGSADVCFEVTDSIDDLKNSLEEKGLAVELGVVERTGVNGAMRSIYLRDFDGNLIEFCSYK